MAYFARDVQSVDDTPGVAQVIATHGDRPPFF
jgi:hypothetical protein